MENRNLIRALLASIAALLLLGLPAGASASPGAVIQDCVEDGDLDGSYSNEDKRAAANNLPADVQEYSDCREVILGAITSARSSGNNVGSTGGTSGGSVTKPKKHQKNKAKSKKSAKKKKKAHKRKRKRALAAVPGGSGNDGLFQTAKASDGMPLPLLLALILGAALSAAAGIVLLRKRRPELGQGVLSRVPRFRR